MLQRSLALGISSVLILLSCGSEPPSQDIGMPLTECDGCVSAELSAELTDTISTEFGPHIDIPGLVVAIRSPQGSYDNAFGWANRAAGTPMTVDAVFGIGSVHKVFKWTALHLVAQDGLIDLDSSVNDYVTEPTLPGVTVRHLMQHSAGLPDLPDIDAYNAAIAEDQTRLFTYGEVMALVDRSSGSNSYGVFAGGQLANFEPGQNMSYSSVGPVVGLEIVEAATGQDALSFTTERIFEPLGMASTSHMGFEPDPAGLTEGYATADTVNPFFPNAAATMGLSSSNGGAIHSTAGDVADFGHALFVGDELLDVESQENLFATPLQGPGVRSGDGVIQFDDWRQNGWWGHAGFGIRSHSTVLLHQPELDLTVAVFTNVYTPLDNYETNVAVADAILGIYRELG